MCPILLGSFYFAWFWSTICLRFVVVLEILPTCWDFDGLLVLSLSSLDWHIHVCINAYMCINICIYAFSHACLYIRIGSHTCTHAVIDAHAVVRAVRVRLAPQVHWPPGMGGCVPDLQAGLAHPRGRHRWQDPSVVQYMCLAYPVLCLLDLFSKNLAHFEQFSATVSILEQIPSKF